MASNTTDALEEKPTKEKPWSHPDRHWEVRDAMHTMLKAEEHKRDPALMKEVRKHAAAHADHTRQVSHHAGRLAKMGKISTKALAKMRV
jgi:hypothetical protein